MCKRHGIVDNRKQSIVGVRRRRVTARRLGTASAKIKPQVTTEHKMKKKKMKLNLNARLECGHIRTATKNAEAARSMRGQEEWQDAQQT